MPLCICSIEGENRSIPNLEIIQENGDIAPSYTNYPGRFNIRLNKYLKVGQFSAIMDIADETLLGGRSGFYSFYLKNTDGWYGLMRYRTPEPLRNCCNEPYRGCQYLSFLDFDFATFNDGEECKIPVDVIQETDPIAYCETITQTLETLLMESPEIRYDLCMGEVSKLKFPEEELKNNNGYAGAGGLITKKYQPKMVYVLPIIPEIELQIPPSNRLANPELLPGLIECCSCFIPSELELDWSSYRIQTDRYLLTVHGAPGRTHYVCYGGAGAGNGIPVSEIDRRIQEFMVENDGELSETIRNASDRGGLIEPVIAAIRPHSNELQNRLSRLLGI